MSLLLDNVVGELSRLPGIGRRTALRLALHILRMDSAIVAGMTESISSFRNDIKQCSLCNNLSDRDICPICADATRDRSTICIVEDVGDVLSIENTKQYNGLYHVLGGVISPMMGVGPSDLKIDLLLDNVKRGGIKEVILALSTTMEGETTLFYITRRLAECGDIRLTTIARGIGYGDELEYADQMTIAHAIHNRTKIDTK